MGNRQFRYYKTACFFMDYIYYYTGGVSAGSSSAFSLFRSISNS